MYHHGPRLSSWDNDPGRTRRSMAVLAKAQTARISGIMHQPTMKKVEPTLQQRGWRAIASTLGKSSTIGKSLNLGDLSTKFSSGADDEGNAWDKVTVAGKALDKMLTEPPPMQSLDEQMRINDLRKLTHSDFFLDRICGYNGLVVHSTAWSVVIGFVIFMNCVAIGIEQTLALDGQDLTLCHAFEHVFLAIYTLEFVMNIVEDGFRGLLTDRWFQLDAFLVVVGISTTWFINPILASSGQSSGFGGLFVIRTVRLLRLARMVRLLQYKELLTLVQGFLSSMNTMAYTCMLLFMVIYAFACLGMELIRNHVKYGESPEFTEIVDQYFCNLPRIMLTLVQFIAMDSVASIYTQLVIDDGWLLLYFFAVILMVAIVLMNIVTAVIVNTALETTALDKEAKHRYHTAMRDCVSAELGKLFEFYDQDGNGTFKLQDLMEGPPEVRQLLCKITDMDSVQEIFLEIDVNGDGELTLEEFRQGVLKIVNSETGVETRQFQTKLQTDFIRLFDILERLESNVKNGFERMGEIEKMMKRDRSDLESPESSPDRRGRKAGDEKKDLGMSRQARIKNSYKPVKTEEDKGANSLPQQAPQWVFNFLEELKAGTGSQAVALARASEDSLIGNEKTPLNLPTPVLATTSNTIDRALASGQTLLWSASSESSNSSPGLRDRPSARLDSNGKLCGGSEISTISESTPFINQGDSDTRAAAMPKKKTKLVRKRQAKSVPLETAPKASLIQNTAEDLRTIARQASSNNLRGNADLFSDSGPESPIGSEE